MAYSKMFGYSPFLGNASYGAFRRSFTVAFPPFLAPAGPIA